MIIPFESGNDEVFLHTGENSVGKVCENSGKLDRTYIAQILTAPVCIFSSIASIFFFIRFFDTQNTYNLIERGLRNAFFMSSTPLLNCYPTIL